MVELLDSKEIHSIESRMIALLDRTFLKSTKLDSVDYKKELPKNVKRWFGSKTFEIQLNNLLTELIKFSLLYADSQMKILTAAKVEEGTILTKEAIARATDISENAAKSIIKMLEDDAIYYEGPAKLGRRIEDLWDGQRHKAVSFAHTFSADVATGTTVYRYRQYGVQFMEFSAKIDERTTPQCRALHGTVFDLQNDSVDAYRPPTHHMCRSILRPLPNTRPPSEDMIFENRDFSGTLDSPDDVAKTFQAIEKFNDKYRVSGYVIDKDLSTRVMSDKGVSVSIDNKVLTPGKIYSNKTKTIIESHEHDIRKLSTEKCIVLNTDGKVMFTKTGNASQISFNGSEIKQFKGAIFTHNHPSVVSFSPADIETACGGMVIEMRATDAKYTYSMRLANGELFDLALWNKEIEPIIAEYEIKVGRETMRKIASGELTYHEAISSHWHEVWVLVSSVIEKIEYTRTHI